MIEWRPIETVPKDGTYVLLLVDSGYTSIDKVAVVACYEDTYHPDYRWRDHSNDAITDYFIGDIYAWAPWESPKLDFLPKYKMLGCNDIILAGDEVYVATDNDWIEVKQNDLSFWSKLNGTPLTASNRKVRRKRG